MRGKKVGKKIEGEQKVKKKNKKTKEKKKDNCLVVWYETNSKGKKIKIFSHLV